MISRLSGILVWLTELVLRWRDQPWPGVPVVFAVVDQQDLRRLSPPPGATGRAFSCKFADCVTVARAVVPDLKSIVVVGDSWNRRMVFRGWKDGIAAASFGIEVTEITEPTVRKARRRVCDMSIPLAMH